MSSALHLHSACWECWPVQWQFNWRYRISLTSDKKVTSTLESKNCDDYLHLTAKKRGKVYLSMCKVGIYPRNCQKYLEQLNIWRRIFYQLLKIIPVSTQNFMLSCTVKCFSEYSFGISYDAHAWWFTWHAHHVVDHRSCTHAHQSGCRHELSHIL